MGDAFSLEQRLQLGEGAEVTYRDSYGDTGLHIGAYKGHNSVLKTFLKKSPRRELK